jgi:peptidoglycan/LPS O-acetylase OafA/YrhL
VALPVCLTLFTMMLFRWGFGMYSDFSAQQISMAFLRNLTLLLTLTVLLGYGHKYLNRESRALPYLNRAAFPVYILHQSVMMAVAYFVVQWALPVWGKYALIIVLTLGATMGLYEFAVRRFKPMRLLFGVK